MLSSSLFTVLKLSKTTSPNKLLLNDCVTLYIYFFKAIENPSISPKKLNQITFFLINPISPELLRHPSQHAGQAVHNIFFIFEVKIYTIHHTFLGIVRET